MMMDCQAWPEPVIRVQALADSGLTTIPKRFISQPPTTTAPFLRHHNASLSHELNIPVVDLGGDPEETVRLVGEACRNWGFFQVVNHGVRHDLMSSARAVWREFFNQTAEEKEQFANSPATYEGYGSRLGVQKGAILDWSDYFFLHFMPASLRNKAKWPALPPSLREVVDEYGEEVVKLGGRIMKIMSRNLGLQEDYLLNAFGGEEGIGGCLRVNFYPKCPQPDLTLGISPHSDPGGLTILLPDDHVSGLQVRKDDRWISVKPLPNAFIINLGDQLQIVSNEIYKSVEHKVVVNSKSDRVSLAFFYNPKSDVVIEPAKELVTEERPPLYPPMTFDQYRAFIRTKGLNGKSQVQSLMNCDNN
ncbi:probable 2-oxoglutarate-dependent dioxygenase At5g05600 [Neltuma alba]|uniref:probable 2-oxoglutarate-dependent dioxygenase At5g05600 n=1 Tax=Neltuma alba TaxID=207710 RepID=UPI0010A3E519|nr:probable 2-oxoglutarate-dependent dioxygenase At5g05600 [Prosopis alba]XP_028786541.1 probable 2-oxoglutarate-dependent dioxygenase At5g05600 [Prosopis alba]